MKMLIAVLVVLAGLFSSEASGQAAPAKVPVFDPAGTYDVYAMIGGEERKATMVISVSEGVLKGVFTPEGETEKTLQDVKVEGTRLSFMFPDQMPIPIQLTFEGSSGKGTWGNPEMGTGAIRAVKRSS